MSVHTSAIVHPSAKIHSSVEMGAFALIHENVEIGKNCVVGAYVEINHARIRSGTRIGSHSIIGGYPQVQDWQDAPSIVLIGEDNDIREMVSIHRSAKNSGETVIGKNNMIMSSAHIGHDCVIGSDTVITSYAGLSGHVTVGDFAVIGGHAGIHQFVRIGESAMVGGMTRLVQDVAPFMMAEGHPAIIRGVNGIGLKRRNFPPKLRTKIKEAYKILFRSGMNIKSAEELILRIEEETGEIRKIIDFITSTKRGLTGAYS